MGSKNKAELTAIVMNSFRVKPNAIYYQKQYSIFGA